MTDYLIRFATNLDPNDANNMTWPRYDAEKAPVMLAFVDGPKPLELIHDTYREEAITALTTQSLENPVGW
jgi:acetylcholinesterase